MVNADANLFAQQEANRRRSTWLVIGFIMFFAWVGFGGDLAFGLITRDAPPTAYHHTIPFIGIALTLFAAGTCWYAWGRGADRVLWSTGAWELITPTTPEQIELHNVVEEMAVASGQPMPKLWIIPDEDPNAFATGHDPTTANIAVTEGLLKLLSRDELQAVVAHEMAHIRNYDIRLMTLLAAIVGALALISDGLGRMMRGGVRVGGRGGGRSSGGKRGGAGQLGMILLVLWIISLLLAPLITRLLAMAVSRKREFLADATGAQFTRNPMALASALEKLNAATAPTRSITKGAAHLCIVDPGASVSSAAAGATSRFFDSHPTIHERVVRLRAMSYQQQKRDAAAQSSLPPASSLAGPPSLNQP